MLPPAGSRLLLAVLAVPLAVGAWLVAGHLAHDDPYVRTGFRCLALTLEAAPWPLAALLLLAPRLVPDRAASLGAGLGAAAGAWAAVVAALWCPLSEPLHVVIGHVLPVALLAVVGAVIGARALRMRPA